MNRSAPAVHDVPTPTSRAGTSSRRRTRRGPRRPGTGLGRAARAVAALALAATAAFAPAAVAEGDPAAAADPETTAGPVDTVASDGATTDVAAEPSAPAAATPSPSPTILASDIAPFEVVYDVGNNLITAGSARLSLARDGEDWLYRLSTRPTGVFKLTGKGRIRETSVIRVVTRETGADDPGPTVQLRPLSYAYRQDDEKRRSVDAAFDWDTRTMSWTYRGEQADAPFADPVLDRLSVTLAVMNYLRQGFEELELQVFDSGRIKTMRFVNEGVETIETKMGEVETIRVRGRNADGGSRSTRTWFAPSLDYVPVRIEQRKRDELVARMNLLKLKNRVTDIELADPDALDESPSRPK